METVIIPADELNTFTAEQVEAFSETIRMGLGVDCACSNAGISKADLTDLLATRPSGWLASLELESVRPLTEVGKRMRLMMLNANDERNPLPFRETLQVLERLAPQVWREQKSVDLTSKGEQLGRVEMTPEMMRLKTEYEARMRELV